MSSTKGCCCADACAVEEDDDDDVGSAVFSTGGWAGVGVELLLPKLRCGVAVAVGVALAGLAGTLVTGMVVSPSVRGDNKADAAAPGSTLSDWTARSIDDAKSFRSFPLWNQIPRILEVVSCCRKMR